MILYATSSWHRAREVGLSPIDFLTRTGHMCSNVRQEFILLSDTLGISMLVDAVNHRMPEGATQTTVLGPFYVQDPPEFPLGFDVSRNLKGEKLFVEGTVSSSTGKRLANAVKSMSGNPLDGFYDVQRTDLSEPTLRGRFRSDAQGRFYFWWILLEALSDSLRWSRRRYAQGHSQAPLAPGPSSFHDLGSGTRETCNSRIRAGRCVPDTDAVFGVKNSLIREYTQEEPGMAADGTEVKTTWRKLNYDFGLKPSA